MKYDETIKSFTVNIDHTDKSNIDLLNHLKSQHIKDEEDLKSFNEINSNGKDEFNNFYTYYVNKSKLSNSGTVAVEKFYEKAKLKTNNKISIEAIYCDYINKINKYYRFMPDNTDASITVYEWVGNHYKKVNDIDLIDEVSQWVRLNSPQNYYPKKIDSIVKQAKRSFPNVPTPLKKQNIVPLKNVWLELRDDNDFYVIEPTKKYFINYYINCDYHQKPGEKCLFLDYPENSSWGKLLNGTGHSKEVLDILQEYAGYTFLPDVRYGVTLFNIGSGGNGKSVWTNSIAACHNNVACVDLLNSNRFANNQIYGASLGTSDEIPSTCIDENFLKAIVTGDGINIERKGKDGFKFNPTAKYIFSGNAFPKFKDGSDGIKRRIIFVNWKNSHINNPDPLLNTKIIETELHLVVNYALKGLTRLLKKSKFDTVDELVDNFDKHNKATNSLFAFMETQCYEIADNNFNSLPKQTIYDEYKEFCLQNNFNPYGSPEFWTRLNNHFKGRLITSRKRVKNVRVYYINLKYSTEIDEINENPFE